MNLLIAGTAGADPEGLREAIVESEWSGQVVVVDDPKAVRVATRGADVAIVALDSSMPAGEEELLILAHLAAAHLPTALVACRVDAYPAWPKTITASRKLVDPAKALPLFATAAALAATANTVSGIDEVLRWFDDRDADEGIPQLKPVANGSGPSQAVARADRLAGLRAGIVAARAESVTAVRSAAAVLAAQVPSACAATGFTDWLPQALMRVDHRAMAALTGRLHQVRAAATRGLPGDCPPPITPSVAGPMSQPMPERSRTRSEDVMMLVVGASMGFGVGRMVISPALHWAGLGAAATVFALLAGLAMAGWVVSIRCSAISRVQLQRWASELITTHRAALESRIGAELGAAEAQYSRDIWNRTQRVGV